MKTVHKIEFTTYTVDDHPHPERCIEYVCENWHDLYTDQEENANSLRGFCEYNSFTMVDYSVSLCGHSFAIANVPRLCQRRIARLRGCAWMKFYCSLCVSLSLSRS